MPDISLRILIVDDERAIRRFLTAALMAGGQRGPEPTAILAAAPCYYPCKNSGLGALPELIIGY